MGCKLGAAVGGDTEGESMEAEDLAVEEVSYAFRVDVGGAGEGMEKLAVVVDEDDDGIMSIGIRKLGDKVDSNGLPGAIGYLQGLSRGAGVLGVFLPGTDVATFHILLDKGSHGRPPVLSFDPFESSVYTRMARGGIVVALLENVASKFIVGGNVDSTLVVNKAIIFLPFSETRGETTGTCLAELGESIQDLGFSGAGLPDTVLQGVDDHARGGELGKQLGFEYHLLFVVLSVGDLVNIEAGEGVGLGVGFSRAMGE